MNTTLFLAGASLMLGSILLSYPVWMPLYRANRYKRAIQKLNAPKK